jgi:NO-binding membrane sensor protein with MHYT domain
MEGTLIGKLGGAKRVIAVLTTLTVLGLYAMIKEVPESLVNVWLLIIGTYFGQSIANKH